MRKKFDQHVFVVQPQVSSGEQKYLLFESVYIEVGDHVFIRIDEKSVVQEISIDSHSVLRQKKIDTWTQTYFPLEWHQERYSSSNFLDLYELLQSKKIFGEDILNILAKKF